MGVDDGAGGFSAEDLGLLRGVEACAEVSARTKGLVHIGSRVLVGKGGWFTCQCS